MSHWLRRRFFVAPLRERLLEPSNGATASVEALLSPAGGVTREMLQDLRKALMRRTIGEKASFRGALMEEIDLERALLTQADFSQARMASESASMSSPEESRKRP